MTIVAVLFWVGVFLVFYTYIGYGMVLRILVALREMFFPRAVHPALNPLPEVTLLIAAYNEESIVTEKMANIRAQDYPAAKLHVVWITDGSTDQTMVRLAQYAEVQVLHEAARGGKTAALNRAMPFITTPIVICTDANTMLNVEAVSEIVRCFADPKVGCVAGEKRVAGDGGAAAT
ncbi:MAG: glycosyltransferase, partial [Alistipes sp.]